jgi:hypothetical protein
MADGAQYLSVFLRVGVILTEHLGVGDDIAQGLVRHTPPPFPVFDDIGQIESIDHPGGKLNRIVACHKTGTPVLL